MICISRMYFGFLFHFSWRTREAFYYFNMSKLGTPNWNRITVKNKTGLRLALLNNGLQSLNDFSGNWGLSTINRGSGGNGGWEGSGVGHVRLLSKLLLHWSSPVIGVGCTVYILTHLYWCHGRVMSLSFSTFHSSIKLGTILSE